MKIVYSAGNRVGANSQLQRFMENVSDEYVIKIAAYIRSSRSLPHIDWTLDALHCDVFDRARLKSIFRNNRCPRIDADNVIVLLSEIEQFGPDLIICDNEPILANIANVLKVRLWYCSPIHLLDGICWERDQLRYLSKTKTTIESLKHYPEPEKIFVYSPFGDINFRPILRDQYEWITPYYYIPSEIKYNDFICVINDFDRFGSLTKIINSCSGMNLISPFDEAFFNMKHYSDNDSYIKLLGECKISINTGETSYLADAIYNNKNVCITPDINDIESIVNAILVNEYNIGSDLGQLEHMEKFALEELENSLNRKYKTDFLSKQNYPYLHSRLCYS